MKEGYYWVKPLRLGVWTIGQRFDSLALPEGHYWLVLGELEEFYDDDMEYIGGRIKGQPDGGKVALEEVL